MDGPDGPKVNNIDNFQKYYLLLMAPNWSAWGKWGPIPTVPVSSGGPFNMPALLQGAPARIRRRGRHSHDLIRAIANDEELSRLVVVGRSKIRDGGSGWVLVWVGIFINLVTKTPYFFKFFKTQESFNIWQQAHLDQNEFRCQSWILFLTAQASRAYIRGHNFAFS